nr:MAG TPA: hypothetical protein [Caudoviricetes sp.]
MIHAITFFSVDYTISLEKYQVFFKKSLENLKMSVDNL